MSFASIQFIFFFLPLSLILTLPFKNKVWKKSILSALSLLFFVWSDINHVFLLLFSIAFNYLWGLLLNAQLENRKTLKRTLWFGVILNLLLLAGFKYGVVLVGIFPKANPNQLPLGISFFTFSGISYLIDIYYRKIPVEKNLLDFLCYFTFFPKISQGPITRYGPFKKQLGVLKANSENIYIGFRRFTIGLMKKVLVADRLGVINNQIFASNENLLSSGVAWFGLFSFLLQIYLDFSGYTDMALGIGKMLGFELPENFDFPYLSKSITEFWRKWHISLTSWFRDYLYTPMAFKWRRKRWHVPFTLLIVFLATGVWHGNTVNFIVWGVFNAVILIVEYYLDDQLKKIPNILRHFYTIVLILCGWLIFRTENLSAAFGYIRALFLGFGETGQITFYGMGLYRYIPVFIIGVLLSFTTVEQFIWNRRVKDGKFIPTLLTDIFIALLFFVSIAFINSSGYQAFIYEIF